MLTAAIALAISVTAADPPAAPAPAPADVFSLADDAFVAQARQDATLLRRYSSGLAWIRQQIPALRNVVLARGDSPLNPDEKQFILGTWAALYDYVLSTELIRQRYWHYWKVPPTSKTKHAWGFLLTHGSLTQELATGLAFADLSTGRRQMEILLDEPSPELGLLQGAFSRFKEKIVHVSTTTQLLGGDAYAKQMLPVWSALGVTKDRDLQWIVNQMLANSQAAKKTLKTDGVTLVAKVIADDAADTTMKAIFPIQKDVAEWMGDTRVHRQGQPLITREQAAALLPRLEPGDIVVVRQNWYLSNIGLPGFWPHAELYLSRPEELAAYFDSDPEVLAWAQAQPEHATSLTALLARRFPEKWRSYGGKDLLGDDVRIVEAISEGVSFTGLGHAFMTDYLAVMRPRLSKLEKAKALARAFAYQGRPYDFDFDFLSDATLVCTELVYKSYAPARGQQGLKLPLVTVAGRPTLPANELVRLFDAEYDRPDRQLDFVAFLDGREQAKVAVESDVASFRQSHRRLKWDIAQK
jgi:hypothetical protein